MSSRYRKHPVIDCPEITDWLELVESGAVESCEEMRALCPYVRKVFANEPLWVDKARLRHYISLDRHFPFDLSVEEKFIVALFLCTFAPGFRLRWRLLLLYVCRGWGKTGFAAYLAFCLISPYNGIPEYDVDICATVETQAKIAYDDLWRLFESDPDRFSADFKWNKEEAYCKPTNSRVKYWSGNSRSKDGMRPGAVLFDEVHAYEDGASMAVFTGGLGKKPHPRRIMTTTDGDVREGPLDEYKARARRILFDGEEDNGFLPFMCKLDSMDEIDDESKWPKANPRLARSDDLMDEYRHEVQEWRENPAKHPEVPTKRFNLPEARRDLAVTSFENLEAASRTFDGSLIRGKPCVVGIDYARTTDMVGACLLYRVGGEWLVVPHAWWCLRSSDAGEVKAPLRDWPDVELVDDVEVDPFKVAAWCRAEADRHGSEIVMASMDCYRFALMKKAMESIGLDPSLRGGDQQVWLTRPSDVMRVQPVIDSAFARHEVAWGDSALMRWATNNAKLEPAPNNCFKYGKVEFHSRKTDPFMAFVHAMCVGDRIPEYAEIGLVPPVFF